MTTINPLQNRVNELNSAILNYINNKVHIMGFYNAERLDDYLTKNAKNWMSIGLYEEEEIDFLNIKNNALFVIQENDIEIKRLQFTKVLKKAVKSKSKKSNIMITIRKDSFSNQYILTTEKFSKLFNTKQDLDAFLLIEYKDPITI